MQSEIADQFEQCFARGLAVIGMEGDDRYLLGVVRMKIERIVLRQLRMPLVHFFETSFSRTYERDIIIVEVVSEGLSGWGEITAGEHPFYNEEWTAGGVADRAGLCGAAPDRPRDRRCRRSGCADPAYSRPQHGARRSGSGGLGSAGPAQRQSAVERDRRRRAQGDSLRRFDRHSGLGGAVDREDRARTGRRLSAHQDEDQAGLGCGRDPAHSRALSRDPADGGRELRLHAGRCRAVEAARRVLSDDDRAAAGARRHHRPRRAAAAARDADLPR